MKNVLLCFYFGTVLTTLSAQTGAWQLWASGLPAGSYPRMAVGPNHDIFYALVGTPGTQGLVYKANTQNGTGNFTVLPAIPIPASVVNNVYCLAANQQSEPVAGLFRNNPAEPWLFRFDHSAQQWMPAVTDDNPSLGAYCMERAPNGTLWVGAKWSYVYKSTDDGHSFTRIDENATVPAVSPCYYPSWFGYAQDGAIYGINVDANGRVYAGTESAGMLYSDDEGQNWHPAEFHPCKDNPDTEKDSSSAMKALSWGGNCAGIGFTADQKLIWTGAAMWSLGWGNALGCADMINHSVAPAAGLPQYLIQTGQQVSKIVTASNGQVFLHSGGGGATAGKGIYTSMDGVNWTAFNTGITGQNDGQSQGSLAVDSNQVFMATHDGKVWRYLVAGDSSTGVGGRPRLVVKGLYPNPAGETVRVSFYAEMAGELAVDLYDGMGKRVRREVFETGQAGERDVRLNVSSLPAGVYRLMITAQKGSEIRVLTIHR